MAIYPERDAVHRRAIRREMRFYPLRTVRASGGTSLAGRMMGADLRGAGRGPSGQPNAKVRAA